jgi:hypothetical protein
MPEQFEIDRQMCLEQLRKWLGDMPAERGDQPYLAIGQEVLTPNQLIEAVEAGDATGRYLVEAMRNLSADLSRRGGER